MSININDFRIAIRIDNSEAKAKFAETKEQIAAVSAEMNKLEAEGKKNSDEYKSLKTQLDKLNTSYAEQRKEVGLTGLSYNELRKGAAKLKAQMDKTIPDTEEWKKLRADYILTKQRMKELGIQAQETKFSISKITDGFNKYAAIGASAIATLTGVAMTARKCVDEYAEMQEAESQVIKYTGMTKEEVADLNEQFKQMDTRTARDKLNALAGDAGRLGITGKKEVMEFVDAADKINVALGEDLGEDAVKNIGKLAQMFGEDEKLGLRGAMLATGSAVNVLGQNSSAAEGYVVAFTARVAGAAYQAKVAQSDIMGYASVLDQNMQQEEMAATAFQTLMMKMFETPATFAKIAGKNVKEFTSLIKTDANEAMLQLLETLNNKGGLDQLAPIFKEMGMEGVRASGVISTMAGKIDDIRSAQKFANDAYRDGTSIINEFNVQNNTVQAGMEKAKKQFKDVRIELGEKLLPVMKYMVTTGSLTVKGLSQIISIFIQYKNVILTGIITITAYIAMKKLQWFWLNKVKTETGQYIIIQKLKLFWDKAVAASTWLYIAATSALTGKTRQAGLAMQGFFNILKLNPFLSIATIIISASAALYLFTRRNSEATRAQILLNKVRSEANANILAEQTEIETLLKIARNETISKERRLIAIKRLNEISPEYLGSLNMESIATDKAKISVDNYVKSLLKMAEIESVKSRLTDTDKQLDELRNEQQEYLNERDTFWGALKTAPRNIGSMLTFGAIETSGGNFKKDIQELEQQRQQLRTLLEGMIKDKIEIESKGGGDGKCPICGNKPCTCGNGGDGKDKKPWNTRLQAAENAYKQEQLLLRQNSDKLAQTENEYQLDALQKESEYQVKRLAIIRYFQTTTKDEKHLEELRKLESESQSQIYDSLKKSEDTRLNLLKEYRNRRLNTVNDGEKQLQLEQSKLYESGELKEKDYKNRLLVIEMTTLFSRLEIAKEHRTDISDLEFQNGEIKAKAVKEAGDSIIALEKQISEKRAEIVRSSANQIQQYNNQFLQTNSLASADQQLDALKSFYQSQFELAQKSGLDTTLLTEVYEEAKKKIEVKGAKDRADVVRKYGFESAEETKSLKLKALEEEHQQGLLSEEEYEIAKNKIANEYLQDKLDKSKQYFDAVGSIAGNASSAIQGFQDAEISKVTRDYDKKIKAAKKAGKDTTKLEEEKEEAINQVKKKYADKQFAASVLQITASTAVAAMEAYKAMAGIPYVGPVLGGIAAAAAIAAGAAQIAVAKQQRDEAKGLKSGGFSDDYVQGYTASGNPDDVAGVIPVHKNEFITNHEGVANPNVRQFLDVFDVAQKNGTIRMINTSQILEQVRTRSGKYAGGYSEDINTKSPSLGIEISSGLTPEQRSQIVSLLLDTNRMLRVLCDKELIVDPRKVRDGIKRVEQLEKNISR